MIEAGKCLLFSNYIIGFKYYEFNQKNSANFSYGDLIRRN